MATYGKWIDLNNEVTQLDENGKNKLYKDKEALEEYLKYIKENTRNFDNEVERVRTLTKEGAYDKLFDNIPDTIIEEMTKLAYSFNFQFQSFMACQKFYESYAVKQYDGDDNPIFVENYEQHCVGIALHLHSDDYVQARKLLKALIGQQYQPSSPTAINSRRAKRGELSSCYIFVVDDTTESINFVVNNTVNASKNAGGVSVEASRIRPKGSSVNGNPNASKGVIPFAKAIEQSVSWFDQGGLRNGSAVVYLNIFHQDIQDFLSAKKINASDKVRLDTLSIGVTIPNKFMELVKSNKDFYTFDSSNLYKETGKHLDEINFNKEYDSLVKNPNIKKKKLNARDLMTEIAKTQLESGYPYVFYIDNANDNHPLNGVGKVRASNLCK